MIDVFYCRNCSAAVSLDNKYRLAADITQLRVGLTNRNDFCTTAPPASNQASVLIFCTEAPYMIYPETKLKTESVIDGTAVLSSSYLMVTFSTSTEDWWSSSVSSRQSGALEVRDSHKDTD